MVKKVRPRNPYIAGRAVGQDRGFFGRADIISLVESELSSPDRNAVVLFGQRRIGKTSILLQLQRRLPSPPFSLVYFDLMDCARKPMGQVLFELASTIASEAGMVPTPGSDAFDDDGFYFQQKFLPKLYQNLGEEVRAVLLLDEFDVLDVAAEEELPSTCAAKAFFPYLRQLMGDEARLGFVFVVGRKAEDLSIEAKATFKAARYKRVSVLDERNARELAITAQRQGTLAFTDAAINRILSFTSCHPYFTQLICQLLWDDAYTGKPQEIPTIEPSTVEALVPKALEAGEHIFEWIWDGLPPAERVIFAAIANETDEKRAVTEDKLVDVLQRYGIRILTRELVLAPDTLVEWEMLRKIDGGYTFFIELMRRWVAARKPLPRVKDELDRVIPLADMLYQSGCGFYRQRDLKSAQNQLQQALTINPNHLKARLLLGRLLCEQGKLGEAIREFEEANRYDEDGARYPLIQTYLSQGEVQEREGKEKEALMAYERVLELSPHEKVAEERRAAILVKRGDEASRAGDLETALAAYQKAGVREKVVKIARLKRRRELLTVRYAEGREAFEQGNFSQAQRALAAVVSTEPDYKDAADLLARAVKAGRSTMAKQSEWQEEEPLAATALHPGKALTNSIGMEFVLIPAGTFVMGSPEDEPERCDDEEQHKVTISKPFYLQTTQVTQGQWKKVFWKNPSLFKDCGEACPVENVSWEYAQKFIAALNQKGDMNKYRLPTEAEWEYACRAGSTTAFFFEDEVCKLGEYAWYNDNSKGRTHPVGQKKPNAWDLYDMHGNVWEWCQDWYRDYPTGDVTDPEGPSTGEFRVLRGGSWPNYARFIRSPNRYRADPDYRNSDVGFRVARDF